MSGITPAPSGLTVTFMRNGTACRVEWRNAPSPAIDYTFIHCHVYTTEGKLVQDSLYNRAVGSQFSYTFEIDTSKFTPNTADILGYVVAEVSSQGHSEGTDIYYPSEWVSARSAPVSLENVNLSLTLANTIYMTQTRASWAAVGYLAQESTAAGKNMGTEVFSQVRVEKRWNTFEWEPHNIFVSPEGWTPIVNPGRPGIRGVRIRIESPFGNTPWVEDYISVGLPPSGIIRYMDYVKNPSNYLIVSSFQIGTPNLPGAVFKRLHSVEVQYTMAVPNADMSCPSNASWAEGGKTFKIDDLKGSADTNMAALGSADNRNLIIFSTDRLLELDECLYLRVVATEIQKEVQGDEEIEREIQSIGEPYLANIKGLLRPPENVILGNPVFDNGVLTGVAACDPQTQVPQAYHKIWFRDADDPSIYDDVGTIQNGYDSEEITVNTSSNQYSIGIQAVSKDGYSMKSEIVWSEGVAIPAPTNVAVLQINNNGSVRVTWDDWEKSKGTLLSWSNDPDAWESTNDPSTYTVSGRKTSWIVAGLGIGETYYFKVQYINENGYGPYSETVPIRITVSPTKPILYLSDTVVTDQETLTAYWAYSSEEDTSHFGGKLVEAIYNEDSSEWTFMDNAPLGLTLSGSSIEFNPKGTHLNEDKFVGDGETYEFFLTKEPDLVGVDNPLDKFTFTGLYSPIPAVTYDKEYDAVENKVTITLVRSLAGTVTRTPIADGHEFSVVYPVVWTEEEEHYVAVQIISNNGSPLTEYSDPEGYVIPVKPTIAIDSVANITESYTQTDIFTGDGTNQRFVLSFLADDLATTHVYVDDISVGFHFSHVDNSDIVIDGLPPADGVEVRVEYETTFPRLAEMPMTVSTTGANYTTLMATISCMDNCTWYGLYGKYTSTTAEQIVGVAYANPDSADIVINTSDIAAYLADGSRYRLTVIATNDYGQSATDTYDFFVYWDHQAWIPGCTVVVDVDSNVVRLTPTSTEDYAEGDVADIYRISADGLELIYSGAQYGTTYVDPYPALGENGGHKIVCRTANNDYITEDKKVAYIDLRSADGDILNKTSMIIDFNGEQIELPYNITLSNSWEKEFERTKYLGGSIVGDWNAPVTRDLSANTVIAKELDTVKAAQMRRLANYPGICHVRTSDGSSFAADIQVKEDIAYNTLTRDFSLEIKKVDTVGFDGMTYSQWSNT